MKTSAGERVEYTLGSLPKKMLNNRVLVRVDNLPDDGVEYKAKNLNIILAGSEWNESARVARYGEVVMVSDMLKNRTADNDSEAMMEWGTEMELEVGDAVWFGIMSSANSEILYVGDDMYYVMPYSRIMVVRRGDDLIPINGYCLLEEVIDKTRVDGLVLDMGDKRNKRRGIVTHVGRRNDWYFGTDAVDAKVKVGDTVAFGGDFFGVLEDEMFATLPKNTGFVQQCWIIAKE